MKRSQWVAGLGGRGAFFLDCTYTHTDLLSARAPMVRQNVYTTYPKINTSAYSSAINDINKRGILQDYTQHSGDHLCALRREVDSKDTREEEGGGGGEAAAIRQSKLW